MSLPKGRGEPHPKKMSLRPQKSTSCLGLWDGWVLQGVMGGRLEIPSLLAKCPLPDLNFVNRFH